MKNILVKKLQSHCEKEPFLAEDELKLRVKADAKTLTNKSFDALRANNQQYGLDQKFLQEQIKLIKKSQLEQQNSGNGFFMKMSRNQKTLNGSREQSA